MGSMAKNYPQSRAQIPAIGRKFPQRGANLKSALFVIFIRWYSRHFFDLHFVAVVGVSE